MASSRKKRSNTKFPWNSGKHRMSDWWSQNWLLNVISNNPALRQSLWYQWLPLALIAWLGSVHDAWTERPKQTFPLHYPPRSVPCHQILAHVYFIAWSCLLFHLRGDLCLFFHILKAKRSWRGSNNFFLIKFLSLLHPTTKMDHFSWKTIKPINFSSFA